jgi:hypothetical protein
MDESPILTDETRPNAGGSYVRLPDGSLMPEADWLAAQAGPSSAPSSAPPPTQPPPAPTVNQPARRRSPEKEA